MPRSIKHQRNWPIINYLLFFFPLIRKLPFINGTIKNKEKWIWNSKKQTNRTGKLVSLFA